MLKRYLLFLNEVIFMFQRLIGMNTGCNHGPNMSHGALYHGFISFPVGMGLW